MKFIHLRTILLILVMICTAGLFVELAAQCPMCRMSAEANLKDGGTAARGLNNGILYIFAFPYILVSIIGYIWWRNY